MKRMLLLGIGAALLAVSASAVVVRVDQVAGYNSGDGEFNISPIVGSGYAAVDMYNNNLGNLGFGTFCIDRNTGLNPLPGNYNATVLAGDPNKGGQLIAQGTAWLFSIFANGGLGTASAIKSTTYNYTPGALTRANSAYFLQLAIWTLEGDYSYGSLALGLANNGFLQDAANFFHGGAGGTAADLATAMNRTGGFGVAVLGLENANGRAQSMLVLNPRVPDGGSALILLGMGLSSIAMVARKFRV